MIEYAYITDAGLHRDHNEDSIAFNGKVIHDCNKTAHGFLWKSSFCVGVFDGVGGESGGDDASRICAEAFLKYGKPQLVATRDDIYNVIQCMQNDLVKEQVRRHNGMQTTFVGAWCDGRQLIFSNIGDSRAYFFSDGQIKQYSYDDTYRNQLLKERRLSKAEIDAMDTAHYITNCFGLSNFEKSKTHAYFVPYVKNSCICLMSDGITDLIDEGELADIIGAYKKPGKIIDAITDAVRARGAHDNFSLVVIKS